MAEDFKNTINRGVNFLARSQQKNGSFLSFSSADKNSFKQSIIYHSTFPASLILACLSKTKPTVKIKQVTNRLAFFLLTQKKRPLVV